MTVGTAYQNAVLTIHATEDNMPCSKVGCVCFSYRGVCSHSSRGSNHHGECTDADKHNGIIRWHRGWTSKATCEQMRQQPETYLNLTCCYTDYCNNQPGKVIKFIDIQTPVQVHNSYDPQNLLYSSIPQKPSQQYNDADHQVEQPISTAHKPSQWNNDNVHHSHTSRLPDMNKPSQSYDRHVHHSTRSRLPDTNKPSQVYDSDVNHSTTPRLTAIELSSQRNQSHIHNTSTSRLPNTHRPSPAYDKSLSQKNTLASSSFSSWMIFFSLIFYFRFIIQFY
ncbi:unnamed protein product [Rotaria sp. Silwood2]|nr:unnamed protein product [Rotaria sp. Silwood2]CAF4629758.1 unnamed protein product [Rotaria sp. Silwood2]